MKDIKSVSLVSIDDITQPITDRENEKQLEELYTTYAIRSTTYKDVFKTTPESIYRSAISQFNSWIKNETTVSINLPALVNVGAFMDMFMDYLHVKKPDVAQHFTDHDDGKRELKRFLYIKGLEAKQRKEEEGGRGFVSPQARFFLVMRDLLKNSRSFACEAGNMVANRIIDTPELMDIVKDENVPRFKEAIISSVNSALSDILNKRMIHEKLNMLNPHIEQDDLVMLG